MRELNLLLVVATFEELVDVITTLAATQTHATALLLRQGRRADDAGRAIPPDDALRILSGRMLTAEQAARLTGWAPGRRGGFSPRFFYAHWRELPFASKPSPRVLRFSEDGLRRWMERGLKAS